MLSIAILAVGGQGGGVLTNWIVDLAPKVAMTYKPLLSRGCPTDCATVYYIEMAPKSNATYTQSPAPGDVDIMIAAELAEAGRAVLRGFVYR